MKRFTRVLSLAAILAFGTIAPAPAHACPMCKTALEDTADPVVAARPKAYMYSILFMISMPVSLATVFGFSFYRLARQQNAINAALMSEYSAPSTDDPAQQPLSS